MAGDSAAALRSAGQIGRLAIAGGLGSIALARMHEVAMHAILPSDMSAHKRARAIEQAARFLANVLEPIEKTTEYAVRNLSELKQSNELLRKRSVELLTANRQLRGEIARRVAAEKSLRTSERKTVLLLEEARTMQTRLRLLSHQILSAQEEERKEISRELHDEIVQTLTGINVQLAGLKMESGLNKRSFSKRIGRTQLLVEKSVNIVHRFARNLRPQLLDDLGLIPALVAYLKGYTERTGLHVSFRAFAGVEKLSNERRTVLFRVAQAALVNVAEHARASHVSLTFREMPKEVSMVIKDNGTSFDVARALDSRRNKRLGLIGMRERVEMVGGLFNVESRPGSGTIISATLPLPSH